MQHSSVSQMHKHTITNNIVVTQATLNLDSLTGPIPFVIIGQGFVVCKPLAWAHRGIYVENPGMEKTDGEIISTNLICDLALCVMFI